MERPYAAPDAKELQWTTTPSEEQLLGSPLLVSSNQPTVTFQPSPPHDWAAPAFDPPFEPATHSPRRRPRARDLIALAAIGAAVWFAVRGVDAAPFRSHQAAAPASANSIASRVVADRRELSSLPREIERASDRGVTPSAHENGAGPRDGKGNHGEGDDDQPAPGHGPKAPLVQATVPGVGSVTVERPDVPDAGLPVPALPDLPETEIAVPGTATVSLP